MSDDVMAQPWCCLTCSWKGTFGKLMARDVLRCPKCNSADLHPFNEPPVTLERAFGDERDISYSGHCP